MKSERLLHVIGMIDENLIAETITNTKIHKWNKKIKWPAAVACLMITSILVTIFPRILHDPAVSDRIIYYSSDNLPKIPVTFSAGDMGGGGSFGHLIVKDYSETSSDNPTFNNVEGITQLPVFKNEEGLWSDYYRELENLKDLIYFKNSVVETTYDYNIDGEVACTWNVCFQYDKKKSLVDQLLDYSFHRIFFTDYFNGNISWARVMKPPAASGILYPIIPLAEAKEKLRNGDFFCYGNEASVAKTAEILSVEIVYLTDEQQSHLQPYYMFYITDSGWDISHILECENKDEFFTVSPVYIPALQDEYLETTTPGIFYN